MIEIIERDHYPEIVENGKGIRRLELTGLNEQLHDPSDRRRFFAGVQDEQFTAMVGYVNAITRGEKIYYEYEDKGNFKADEVPPQEDKAPLMSLAFQAVREIASDATLDDKTALRRAGLTIAGAINLIHPKEDGNGRSGRILHYLIEYGTERGDKAFNDEMYAIIAKLPVYDSDEKIALYDTPPDELSKALAAQVKQSDPERYASMSGPQRASARVAAFLDMMRGRGKAPIVEVVGPERRSLGAEQLDGVSLYEKHYLSLSAIPNRLPDDVPEGAHRVMGEKVSGVPQIRVPIDVV